MLRVSPLFAVGGVSAGGGAQIAYDALSLHSLALEGEDFSLFVGTIGDWATSMALRFSQSSPSVAANVSFGTVGARRTLRLTEAAAIPQVRGDKTTAVPYDVLWNRTLFQFPAGYTPRASGTADSSWYLPAISDSVATYYFVGCPDYTIDSVDETAMPNESWYDGDVYVPDPPNSSFPQVPTSMASMRGRIVSIVSRLEQPSPLVAAKKDSFIDGARLFDEVATLYPGGATGLSVLGMYLTMNTTGTPDPAKYVDILLTEWVAGVVGDTFTGPYSGLTP